MKSTGSIVCEWFIQYYYCCPFLASIDLNDRIITEADVSRRCVAGNSSLLLSSSVLHSACFLPTFTQSLQRGWNCQHASCSIQHLEWWAFLAGDYQLVMKWQIILSGKTSSVRLWREGKSSRFIRPLDREERQATAGENSELLRFPSFCFCPHPLLVLTHTSAHPPWPLNKGCPDPDFFLPPDTIRFF